MAPAIRYREGRARLRGVRSSWARRSRRRPRRWSAARRTSSTRTSSSRSSAGRSRSAATRSSTPPASRRATTRSWSPPGPTPARPRRACGCSTSEAYSFLSDDLTLVTPDGRVLTYPKPLTISRHTLKAVKRPLLSRRERAGLLVQSRLHSRSGRRFALVLPAPICRRRPSTRSSSSWSRRRSTTSSAWCRAWRSLPRPTWPGWSSSSGAGSARSVLDEREALETLMSNCEDAYGFPPYSEIEGSLRRRNGSDLREVERAIVASALSGVPASRAPQRVDGLVASAAGSGPADWTPGPAATSGEPRGSRIVARPRLSARAASGSAWRASTTAGGAARGDARRGGRAARLAAQRRRLQQRRGRLRGPGGRDRGRTRSSTTSSRSSARTRCSSRPFSRSAFGFDLGMGFERFAAAALGRRDRLPGLQARPAPVRPRAGLLAALLMALMPYHVVVTRQSCSTGR